jgi:hypothetical protein
MVESYDISQTSSIKLIKVKTPEDRLIIKVATECLIMYPKDRINGMKHMIKELGRSISEPTYYKYLHMVEDETGLKEWINDQARVGFLSNQMKMTEQCKHMIETVGEKFEKEISRDETDENLDKQYIISLSQQLGAWNKRLEELNLGNPVVATIKYMIDNANKPKERMLVATKSNH